MDIRLPRLGEGADSGSVVSVLVKVGDQIKKDQPLIELENEKAVASIPSTAAGTVAKIHVKTGDKISVGQPLVTLAGAGKGQEPSAPAAEPASSAKRQAARVAPQREPSPSEPIDAEEDPAADGPEPVAAPSVRKIARELGIELRQVRASERGGRIVMADLRAYIERLRRAAAHPAGDAAAAAAPAAAAAKAPQVDFSKWGPVTKQPFSSLRQTIAHRMTASWTSIPHVTQFDEADLTAMLAAKQRYEAAYERQGARLTLTAIILKVLAGVLKAHPKFNSSLDEAAQEVVLKHYYHIGIAVDTEAGLVVPVLRDVDKKTVLQLSKELNALVEKTRQRKVSAEDLQGSTFSISNQGGIGGAHFTPIIKAPDAAILGIGRGAVKPIAQDGKVEPRTLLPLALSYDHRLIDGADAARFIRDLVQAIEQLKEADIKL